MSLTNIDTQIEQAIARGLTTEQIVLKLGVSPIRVVQTRARLDALNCEDDHEGRQLAPCGTAAAYKRHIRRGEPVDAPCRRANKRSEAKRGQRGAA